MVTYDSSLKFRCPVLHEQILVGHVLQILMSSNIFFHPSKEEGCVLPCSVCLSICSQD